ncbi:MAG TPA: hypothetical protein VKN36_02715 [Eudoraea sp.]|nr:hypothetical protein [Eudoraea sp.]
MKAIVTLVFVLFIGTAAQAQDSISEIKVTTVSEGIVTSTREVVTPKTGEVARLYRRPNARVKKALSFTTKRNAPKLA